MKYIIVFAILFALSIFSLQALPPYQIYSPCPNGNTQSVTIIDADQDGEYDTVHFVDCAGKEDFTTIGLTSPQYDDFTGSDSVEVEILEDTNSNIFIDVTIYDSGTAVLSMDKDYLDTVVTVTTLGGSSSKEIHVNEEDFSLLIYPNPSSNRLILENIPLNTKSIRILNSNGEILRNVDLNGEEVYEFDISNLSIGVYFLQIGNGGNLQLHKITKLN